MKILFEREVYDHTLLEEYGLASYAYSDKNGRSILPYVGYFYSATIQDCIFILPKVFIKVDDTDAENLKRIVFGKEFKDKDGHNLDIYSIINIDAENNILKHKGLDKMIFELSTWIYRAINKFWTRHPESEIVRREHNQIVNSVNGNFGNTLLDTILSLEKFHKDHSELFTYISIINKSGHNKIHWPKTISKTQPIIQNGVPYYMELRNKSKIFNYDEELIVLYYSVLQYLRAEHMSSVRPNVNYELLRPAQIKSMLQNGRGTKILRKIRRKYFKDELVQLWKLLYAFFSRAESIYSKKCSSEALLVSSFDRVFEDMIDAIISEDAYANLKKNKDGKRIDHIYRDRSFFGEGDIFHIVDSKYYSDWNELDETSISKQFTYAKYVIQENINAIINSGIDNGINYRDDLTDGYNFTPNYFIRGSINLDELIKNKSFYNEEQLERHSQKMPKNRHFKNRPFDRDTLLLQSYNINFLYILASYVRDKNHAAIQKRLHSIFREDLINLYDYHFKFFKVTPHDEKQLEKLIIDNFYTYRGQMFCYKDSNGRKHILMGFDKAENKESIKSIENNFKNAVDVQEITLRELNDYPPKINVHVAAAITIKDGKVLTVQRGCGEFKGLWEFPGGKIKACECPKDALKREIKEGLDADITVGDLLATVEWDYPTLHLSMHCYICTLESEYVNLSEHKDLKWMTKEELHSVNWMPADLTLLEKIAGLL